ncbi:amidohydrolase family protein [Helicobacter anatolicus]|uniref:amidohydrolase family protein n=1 Tax=Helicobacter anatolicus TaxID=2905874 RepID=UPI001E35FA27|nr:amidohydrolase family protein [Helicobacter anatolicus]MCE3040048.1 amidohydrolase family protein [Helicobacter anatolicus]
MKIDTHAHIFLKNLPVINNARYSPKYDASFEEYHSFLNSFGFQKAVLVQPSFLGTNNDFLLNSIKDNKNFKAIVVVDKNISFEELQKLKENGACGIRLNLLGQDFTDFKDKEWETLFHHIAKLKMQIEIQRDLEDGLIDMLKTLLDFDCNIVIDHLARSSYIDSINLQKLLKLKNSKIFFKISGFYRAKFPYKNNQEAIKFAKEIYEILKKNFSLHNFVFGSDWPHTNFENKIDFSSAFLAFEEIVASKKEREQILGDNACTLFHF